MTLPFTRALSAHIIPKGNRRWATEAEATHRGIQIDNRESTTEGQTSETSFIEAVQLYLGSTKVMYNLWEGVGISRVGMHHWLGLKEALLTKVVLHFMPSSVLSGHGGLPT